jgi:hypothetical protein
VPLTTFAGDKITHTTPDGVEYTDNDITLLARLVWAEARGESYLGQLAVANNVLNRCIDTRYPDTISKNIYRSGQYTVVKAGRLTSKYNDSTLQAATDVLVKGVRVLPFWTLNFQGANRSNNKYCRIGGHTFNYIVRNDNLWRIWCDPVEEPQYFIDKLSNYQIEIALESIPKYYSFNSDSKTVNHKFSDSIQELTIETRSKNIQIEELNAQIDCWEEDYKLQTDILNALRENYKIKSLALNKKIEEMNLLKNIIALILLLILLYIFKNLLTNKK